MCVYVYIMRTQRMCFPTTRLFCTCQRICLGPALVYLIYLGSDLVFLHFLTQNRVLHAVEALPKKGKAHYLVPVQR